MLRVRQVKVSIINDNDSNIKKKICSKLNISSSMINGYKIIKKSIDARDKNNIFYVYEFDVDTSCDDVILKKNKSNDIFISPIEEYKLIVDGTLKIDNRIVIVGAGPAGLLCGYLLAEAGYKPLIIEQGEMVEDRVKTIEHFFLTNELNPLSNIQFGEGGAGTFSDGKLNTLVKDKLFRGKKVFEIFIENGAPEEIMYLAKPHIGTDVLRKVIINMRNKIISMGGEFKYTTKLTDINIVNNKVVSIEVNSKDVIDCSILVLAIGHSARDTFYLLKNKGLNMKSKNFAVGVRIEHPQEMISKSQYGESYKLLPPASYKLVHQTSNGRGVYSFCMCPGGFVVNASSEEGRLVVNGMSNYKRNEVNANSAIVVTVGKEDFGYDVMAGIEFQRKLEENAYRIGCGNIPVQLFKDYNMGVVSDKFGEVIPNTKGKFSFANLNEIFPEFINSAIKEAIPCFDKKIKGFGRDDAILLGVESRTSSPVIIERGEDGISNIEGIYPCGEGAGYAGGITTAAIDGVKVAENICHKYNL